MLREYVRPPGALAEAEFVTICDRCRECEQACPYGVIVRLSSAYGPAAGTPALLPRDGPCRLCTDLPCATACPTGALKPVPVAEVGMGTARLDPARCWAAFGQPCDYCVKMCPVGEKALRWSGNRPEVNEEHCTGCGMCDHICPAPGGAFRIVPTHA
jgi:ferredoxin-type protein NapG